MELSDRKKKILQIVIDDYIEDGVPISSKGIHDNHLKNVSPATIRSELAQLEELGYLGHLHTSSGRVPLANAYKFYVDRLMESGELTTKEIDHISSRFNRHIAESEYIVASATKLISEMTDYTAVGFMENVRNAVIANIKLVKLTEDSVMLIVITDTSIIKDSIIATKFDPNEQYLVTAEKLLCEELAGKRLCDVTELSLMKLGKRLYDFKEIFDDIVSVLREYVAKNENSLVLEGSNNIFKHDEFRDIDTTKQFMQIVEDKSKLKEMLSDGGLEISVKIGDEDGSAGDGFALVKATYSINGKPIGGTGVLGPKRMDYKKVITALKSISAAINTIDGDRKPAGKKGVKEDDSNGNER